MQFWRRLVCGLAGLLSVGLAQAGNDQGLSLSTSATHFAFSEFNDQGNEAVKERGIVYGGKVDFRKRWDRLYIGARLDGGRGTVDYDGLRQLGDAPTPYQTQTTETIWDGSFQIGRVYESWRTFDFSVIYAGVGYHQWVRDIKTRVLLEEGLRKTILGPFEVYRWGYVQVGARGFLFRTDRMFVLVDFNLLRTVAPSMTANLKGLYDDQKLELGTHFSGRISMPVRYEITHKWLLSLEPFYEAWDIGRSEHVPLTEEGGSMTSMGSHQPRSTSRHYGVDFGIQYEFN